MVPSAPHPTQPRKWYPKIIPQISPLTATAENFSTLVIPILARTKVWVEFSCLLLCKWQKDSGPGSRTPCYSVRASDVTGTPARMSFSCLLNNLCRRSTVQSLYNFICLSCALVAILKNSSCKSAHDLTHCTDVTYLYQGTVLVWVSTGISLDTTTDIDLRDTKHHILVWTSSKPHQYRVNLLSKSIIMENNPLGNREQAAENQYIREKE